MTDTSSGEVVCCSCGLVITDLLIDQQPEWRAFTPEEQAAKSRVGIPRSLTWADKGLPTTFHLSTDSTGTLLPLHQRLMMMRLRRWNRRARSQVNLERNLAQALNVIRHVVDQLSIPPDVEEYAAWIYRKALKQRMVRGRSIHGLAIASLYAACRHAAIPRSLQAMVQAGTGTRKEISRYYRLLHHELALTMPIDDPLKFIPLIASQTQMPQQTQNMALELLRNAHEQQLLTGKSPAGLAAAALYLASICSGKKTTQQRLAQAANVTEVTVRNLYKRLKKNLRISIRT